MKHKHYDMIVAKAENMDLVIFRKDYQNTPWRRVADSELPTDESKEYFLCLPQHKDAVLNVLNGGKSEIFIAGVWHERHCGNPVEWFGDLWHMNAGCKSRIRPRKEKRWIGVRASDGATTEARTTAKKARSDVAGLTGNWQFIKIEVEV